jgi:hypothetical protein
MIYSAVSSKEITPGKSLHAADYVTIAVPWNIVEKLKALAKEEKRLTSRLKNINAEREELLNGIQN